MTRLPRVESRELIRALERAGFVPKRQQGSHLHLFHASGAIRVTVPVHAGKTVPAGTLKSILRDANLSVADLIRLLES
ncbi:MAG: hypothetical protein C0506_10980 [Anaerolinea sp.]|nr:hypothetical protein [Anaerolinea sp.]